MTYSVFMLKDTAQASKLRYMSHEYTLKHGGVRFDNYETVYTGEIEPGKTAEETLEEIFALFNFDRPADYHGRFLNVSDLVALEETGTYFCDSIGWRQIN